MKKKIILISEIGLLVILILGLIAIIFFKLGQASFQAEGVKLEIIAPEEVVSGQEITYLIEYNNHTKVSLEGAELSFQKDSSPPELYEIGRIEPDQKEQIEIKATLFGQKGDERLARATLRYIPANFSSYFTATAHSSTLITSAPLLISLNAPLTALDGQEIGYSLDYVNTSQDILENIKIEFIYPAGFIFKKAMPEPEQGENIWQIEKIEPNKLTQIKIQGVIQGEPGESKEVIVNLDHFSTTTTTQILQSPLEISQDVPSSVEPGEELIYKIKFRNASQISLKDVELSVQLTGQAFDFKTLEIEQGSFDKYAQKIFWHKVGVPQLAQLDSDQGGEVSFSINTKKKLPSSSQVISLAQIKSKDIFTIDEKITKIKTRLTLNSKGYYRETTSNIKNSGPVPPKVGQATTYTIHWQLTNLMNEAEDVSVVAIIPDEIEWTGQTQANAGEIVYDAGEKKVVIWDIGEVPANTGVSSPAYEAVFQLSLTPTLDQVGEVITLINEATLTGIDSFANVELSDSGKEISTQMPDDPTVGLGHAKVVP